MADINATSLNTKTTPDGTDNLVLFNQNTNVGYQIDYDNLADAILNKITSKPFANQVGGSSAATILAQLATLNSNIVGANIACTPESGFTVAIQSGAIVGNLVYGYLDIKGTIPARTWTTVGTLQVAARPSTAVHVGIISRATGAPCGMARINLYGKVDVFGTVDINDVNIVINFIYNKTQSI